MLRIASSYFLIVLLTSCGDSPVDPSPRPSSPPPAVPTDAVGAPHSLSLESWADTFDIVGTNHNLTAIVYDASRRLIDPTGLVVTSSNPEVAVVRAVNPTWSYTCDSLGVCVKSWRTHVVVLEVGAGTASITASLGSARDSETLTVRPLPTAPAALVIDSFRVVEYSPNCAWACTYRAYIPLVWMRQPDGAPTELLQGINFTIPTQSTGWCRYGGLAFRAGDVRRVNQTFDPYLWNNDFFLVDLHGPIPDGPATVQVLVSDLFGELRIAEATAPIERNGTPTLGEPASGC